VNTPLAIALLSPASTYVSRHVPGAGSLLPGGGKDGDEFIRAALGGGKDGDEFICAALGGGKDGDEFIY